MPHTVLSKRPPYTHDEMLVLAHRPAAFRWVTSEAPPRRVRVLARPSANPDVTVVRLGTDDTPYQLMSCGDERDGLILDEEVWVVRDPTDTRQLLTG
jgi:hypothetical protein